MSSQAVVSTPNVDIHSGWAILIYVVVPWFPIIIGVRHLAKTTHWRGGSFYVFLCNFMLFLYKFAPFVSLGMFLWTCVMILVQGSYLYTHMTYQKSLEYYLRVNLPQYEYIQALSSAATQYSFNTAMAVKEEVALARRRLQMEAAVQSTLSLVYQDRDLVSNVIDPTILQLICESERDILSNVTCIDDRRKDTFLTQIFDTSTCVMQASLDEVKEYLANTDNTRFVQDNVNVHNVTSAILISYFDIGTCGETYTPKEFSNAIDAYTSNLLTVTYVNHEMERDDFYDVIGVNLLYYGILGCIIAFILLIIGLRGIFVSIIVFFSSFFAAINAAAMLPLLDYHYYSLYSGAGIMIMLIYACNMTTLYAAAWRRNVGSNGVHPTVPQILHTYLSMISTMFYVTVYAEICTFVLMLSPVIVVKQFGAFTGLAIASYFLAFHYLVMPCWIWASWYVMKKGYHKRFNAVRDTIYKPVRDVCCEWGLAENPLIVRMNTFFDETGIAAIGSSSRDARDTEDRSERGISTGNNRRNNRLSRRSSGTVGDASAADTNAEEEGEEDDGATVTPSVIPAEEVQFVTEFNGQLISANGPVALGREYNPNEVQTASIVNLEEEAAQQAAARRQSRRRGSRGNQSADGNNSNVGDDEDDLEDLDDNDIPANELEQDTQCCRGKRPLKFLGFFYALLFLGVFLLALVFAFTKVEANLGIATTIFKAESDLEDDSNLGRLLSINLNYKSDLFRTHDANTIIVTANPTYAPTRAPTTLSFSTRSPTRFPTKFPTLMPSQSLAPANGSAAPTIATDDDAESFVDFRVSLCYGITPDTSSGYIDDLAGAAFDQSRFASYVSNGGMIADVKSLCDYVDAHRDDLDIMSDWVKERDCLYSQLTAVADAHSSAVTTSDLNLLTLFAETSYTAGSYVGYLSNSSASTSSSYTVARPAWLCANFSSRTYFSEFDTDTRAVNLLTDADASGADGATRRHLDDIRQKWVDAMNSRSSGIAVNARSEGVNVFVTSDAFTYPLLPLVQKDLVTRAIAAIVVGIAGLIFLFSLCDFGLTFFGCLGVWTVLAITLCVHVNILSSEMDMLDLMAYFACSIMVVEWPVHIVFEYMAARSYMDTQQTTLIDKALSPVLARTVKYTRPGSLVRSLVPIAIGFALTTVDLRLFSRLGSFLVILSVVSLLFSRFVQPYLLAFGCRTRYCEKICYVEEEEYFYDEANRNSVDSNAIGMATVTEDTEPAATSAVASNDSQPPSNAGSTNGDVQMTMMQPHQSFHAGHPAGYARVQAHEALMMDSSVDQSQPYVVNAIPADDLSDHSPVQQALVAGASMPPTSMSSMHAMPTMQSMPSMHAMPVGASPPRPMPSAAGGMNRQSSHLAVAQQHYAAIMQQQREREQREAAAAAIQPAQLRRETSRASSANSGDGSSVESMDSSLPSTPSMYMAMAQSSQGMQSQPQQQYSPQMQRGAQSQYGGMGVGAVGPGPQGPQGVAANPPISTLARQRSSYQTDAQQQQAMAMSRPSPQQQQPSPQMQRMASSPYMNGGMPGPMPGQMPGGHMSMPQQGMMGPQGQMLHHSQSMQMPPGHRQSPASMYGNMYGPGYGPPVGGPQGMPMQPMPSMMQGDPRQGMYRHPSMMMPPPPQGMAHHPSMYGGPQMPPYDPRDPRNGNGAYR